ncbi:uncharacterized protein LOC131233407 isoform X2 [Magnolia sinica]|uniref:uncharacterized protein LOC131233407 isoform X2 n=1 Tax=Magnolia sinica TaxID=86752 RepID=UPI002657D771|nr:uncharacterized protein LOC131233407 isoform X2 [Magnolia sinica]
MDFQEKGESDGSWTNEKHISFLNSMEASFVRSMLRNDDRCSLLTYAQGHPRLDRIIPDSAESTLDLKNKSNRGKTHRTNIKSSVGIDKKMRKCSYRPDNASKDQVVPQLASMKNDI